MARRIVITIPDDVDVSDESYYVEAVAEQLEQGYLSGHVDVEHHWTIEYD